MYDAINFAGAHNVVFVTAAGNDGTNTDFVSSYPGSYRLPNEITVAAIDSSGYLAGFSDYGAHTVDLAAPGVGIWSTIPGGFAQESGTSMATPYVTGVVSLLVGIHPEFSATQLVHQVLATTKPLPSLSGRTITGGMVDAAQALGVTGSGLPVNSQVNPTRTSTLVISPYLLARPSASHGKAKPVRRPVFVPHRKPVVKHRQAPAKVLVASAGTTRVVPVVKLDGTPRPAPPGSLVSWRSNSKGPGILSKLLSIA